MADPLRPPPGWLDDLRAMVEANPNSYPTHRALLELLDAALKEAAKIVTRPHSLTTGSGALTPAGVAVVLADKARAIRALAESGDPCPHTSTTGFAGCAGAIWVCDGCEAITERASPATGPIRMDVPPLTKEGEHIAPLAGDPPCDEYDEAGLGAGAEPDGLPQCAACGHPRSLHPNEEGPRG